MVGLLDLGKRYPMAGKFAEECLQIKAGVKPVRQTEFVADAAHISVMPNDFPHSKAVRMLRVVTMGGLAYGTVYFDNPEIPPRRQLFPGIEADIQPAVIKATDKSAHPVDRLGKLGIYAVTFIRKQCPAGMVPEGS